MTTLTGAPVEPFQQSVRFSGGPELPNAVDGSVTIAEDCYSDGDPLAVLTIQHTGIGSRCCYLNERQVRELRFQLEAATAHIQAKRAQKIRALRPVEVIEGEHIDLWGDAA